MPGPPVVAQKLYAGTFAAFRHLPSNVSFRTPSRSNGGNRCVIDHARFCRPPGFGSVKSRNDQARSDLSTATSFVV
ncbi:MAG: hypothetical protein SPG40_10935 [Kiritimatiellia bacterium]|nr:hypothetical protein [Kiritimatiellia bacterium]